MKYLVAWLEKLVLDFPNPRKKANKITSFVIEQASIFKRRVLDGMNALPFSFLEDLYRKRRKINDEIEPTGCYNIKEKAISSSIRQYMKSLRSLLGQKEKLRQLLIRITPPQRRRIAAAGFRSGASRSSCDRFFSRPTASCRLGL